MKEEESEEGGGKFEVMIRGLVRVGREETGGRVAETGGLLMETGLVPGRDRGLDRPETQRTDCIVALLLVTICEENQTYL